MMRSERGSMLIIALWTLSILSLLAIGSGTAAWTEMKLTSLELDSMHSERLLQGGLELIRQTLSDPKLQTVTAFKDAWANQPAFFQNASLLDGCLTIQRPTTDGSAVYGLEDEQARINLNTASAEVLSRLFGEDQDDLVNAIVAWRGGGGTEAGAVDDQNDVYKSLAHPYACKAAPFESVEELLMIQGMTPALYEKIRPWVTVYTNGLVNINTAPRPVLLALGFSDALIDKVLQHRLGADGKEGTDDDGVFTSAASVVSDLNADSPLLMDESSELDAAQPLLCVRSTCFRAHFKLSPGCDAPREGLTAEVVLTASGLQGQWIIRHFSTL